MKSWPAQLRKGLVELAVLAALRDEEAYGYQLLQKLNACLLYTSPSPRDRG